MALSHKAQFSERERGGSFSQKGEGLHQEMTALGSASVKAATTLREDKVDDGVQRRDRVKGACDSIGVKAHNVVGVTLREKGSKIVKITLRNG